MITIIELIEIILLGIANELNQILSYVFNFSR